MNTTLDAYISSPLTIERCVWNVIRGLRRFTADDLHVLEEEITRRGYDLRVIGAVLKSFERKGLIRKVGYVCSRRSECHGRPIVEWIIVEA